jgi:hypothetical protein
VPTADPRRATTTIDPEQRDSSGGDGSTVAGADTESAVDNAPEQAGELSELGVRLPWTGNRVDRGEQDTDDDMF